MKRLFLFTSLPCRVAVLGLLLAGAAGCQKEVAVPVTDPLDPQVQPQSSKLDFSRQFTLSDFSFDQDYASSDIDFTAKRLPATGLTIEVVPQSKLLVPAPNTDPAFQDFESLEMTISAEQLAAATTGTYPFGVAGTTFEYGYGRSAIGNPAFTVMRYTATNSQYGGSITLTKYQQYSRRVNGIELKSERISGNYEVTLNDVVNPLNRFGDQTTPQTINAVLKGNFTDLLVTK